MIPFVLTINLIDGCNAKSGCQQKLGRMIKNFANAPRQIK
jgi:hypothetical protein